MLVTFQSQAYADITMFGAVAVQLLRMMGHSGTVPGALLAEDIPAALQQLKTALAAQARAEQPPAAERHEDDGEPPVSMAHRALPLITLLEASHKAGCDVMWDR